MPFDKAGRYDPASAIGRAHDKDGLRRVGVPVVKGDGLRVGVAADHPAVQQLGQLVGKAAALRLGQHGIGAMPGGLIIGEQHLAAVLGQPHLLRLCRRQWLAGSGRREDKRNRKRQTGQHGTMLAPRAVPRQFGIPQLDRCRPAG